MTKTAESAITMNNALVILTLACVAISAVVEGNCPAIGCTMEFYPDKLHLPKFMVYNGEECALCNKWMDKAPQLDENGCPLIQCTLQAAACPRESYFVWNGKNCPDCIEDFC